MNRALASFALIKSSLRAGTDCLGAFVPLMVCLFSTKKYTSVDIETICNDFLEEFDIQIPRRPMETILNRMKRRYLVKERGRFYIKAKEIEKQVQTINLSEERQKFSWLLNDFIDFCKNFQTSVDIEYEEADDLLTSFLKQHDLDIMFALSDNDEISILPGNIENIESDKKYLVNRYVNILMKKGGEFANYLIDCAIGHNYASTILYREFQNIRGRGTCANYYLDIGLLFDLMGINGAFRRDTVKSFLTMLRSKGSNLKVFKHNYNELLNILDGCLTWIENKNYEREKASKALIFFKDEGSDKEDVELFIARIPKRLSVNNIETVEKPNPDIYKYYQIDREELKKVIINTYNKGGHFFNFEEREDTLDIDIDSIESIYKLRRGNVPINLNEAAHVFMTTNSGLAYASAKFEKLIMERGHFTIPTVLTDVFIGTMVWIQEPSDLTENFSRSKIIAYTNAAIKPKVDLMNRFALEVEKAKKNDTDPISDESASLLLESSLTRELLTDHTLADLDRVSSKTPYEILNELTRSLSAKYEEEKCSKESAEDKLKGQTENIEDWICKRASATKWGVTILLFVIAVTSSFLIIFSDSPSVVFKIINYVITFLGGGSALTIVAFGKKIEKKIREILLKQLIKS